MATIFRGEVESSWGYVQRSSSGSICEFAGEAIASHYHHYPDAYQSIVIGGSGTL